MSSVRDPPSPNSRGRIGVTIEPGAALDTKPYARTEEEASGLRSPDLVPFDASALWTDNAKVQFAWDLRDALGARIRGKAEGERTEAERFLAEKLRAIDSGAIDRQVANEVFTSMARGLSSDQAYLRIDESVEKILGRSLAQLKTALAELDHPKKLKGARVDRGTEKPNKSADLGRRILERIFERSRGTEPDAAAELFRSVPRASAYVWGRLAETVVGARDPAGFFRELESAKPDEIAAVKTWLAETDKIWSHVKEAVAIERSAPDLEGAKALIGRCAVHPESSKGLVDQVERLSFGLENALGLDPVSLSHQIRARQRQGALALRGMVERLETRLGAEKTARIVSTIDVEKEIARLADPRDGLRYYTDLDSFAPIRSKAAVLAARLDLEGRRLEGDALRAQILADPTLFELAKILARHPADAAYVRSAMADVLEYSGTKDRLAAEFAADPRAFAADFSGVLEEHRAAEAGVREDAGRRAAQKARLDQGILQISKATMQAIEAHMDACYPQEGMGYLATDGRATYFVPVKNAMAAAGLGHDRGADDPEDAARFVEEAARADLTLLAKVHSHPDSSPVFSDADLEGMRATVAIAPEVRTLIVEVSKTGEGFAHRAASFESRPDGRVHKEDRIEVA